jgi:hypothetical protein
MATTVTNADVKIMLSVVEKLSNATLTLDPSVTHEIKIDTSLTSGTAVDAEVVYGGVVALSGGTATIDLKALTNVEGDTIITEAKKVRAIAIKPTVGNANAITLTEGASNGYELLGNGWTLALEDGDVFSVYLGDNAPAISDTTKNIDMSGTAVQSVSIIIVFG